MAGPAARSGHRDYLDGLRALAALWVVLSHVWISGFGVRTHDGWLGLLTNWTIYSHFAVDTFIVLSGFCLILPVARDGGLQGGARVFFVRRARRILPPFYAALAVSVLLRLVLQGLDHHPLVVNSPALLANVFLLQDLFRPLNIFNGPFWSIAVEWRIYFVFPWMVWALLRWGTGPVTTVSALLSLVLTILLIRLHPEMLTASPWYLLLFALGVCAGSLIGSGDSDCEAGRRFWLPAFLLAALTLAGLLRAHPVTAQGAADFGVFMPIMDVAAGAAMAAGLLLISRSPHWFPLLSWRPLVSLGTFSYSLYLVHMPCLLLLNYLITACHLAPNEPLSQVALLLSSLPLIIGLAYLFFLAFERPFLSRRAKGHPS